VPSACLLFIKAYIISLLKKSGLRYLAEASSAFDVKFVQASITYWSRIKNKTNLVWGFFYGSFSTFRMDEKTMQPWSTGRQLVTQMLLQVTCSKN
jgi:hypothetical protein